MEPRAALIALSLAVLAACHATSIAREPGVVPLAPVFGPIVGSEVIGGRAADGDDVWLLAGLADLVHVDLQARRSQRVMIRIGPGDQCWGLARLDDGSLWTLKGRRAVIRIAPGGEVIGNEPLTEPHLGLFGAQNRLVYQVANLTSPGPALRAGAPGDSHTLPWSEMKTRGFDRLARASAAALNMVACGGRRAEGTALLVSGRGRGLDHRSCRYDAEG